MKKLIIGVVGKAGSGKSTMCDFLGVSEPMVVLNFADPLKRMLLHGFNGLITEEMLWGPSENRLKRLPYFNTDLRTVLQKLGTESIRKQFNENLWANYGVDLACEIIEKNCIYNKLNGNLSKVSGFDIRGVVIGDCRFLNEAKCIKEAGGILVKIERKVYTDKGLTDEQKKHASESEMDSIKCDYTIQNNGVNMLEFELAIQQMIWHAQHTADRPLVLCRIM